jgi:KDO2-lipid IV(A) lauroyltransferase
MQAMTRVIEDWIRENPGQWLWMHRRWRPAMLPKPKPGGPQAASTQKAPGAEVAASVQADRGTVTPADRQPAVS